MEDNHWNPGIPDPDTTEEVTDNTPALLPATIWQFRLPSSKKADPIMLTVALRHGMTLDHTDKS